MSHSSDTTPSIPAYHRLHENAVSQGADYYTDPQTGYLVFTALYHQKRGACCQSACRHCPFGFQR